LNRPDSLLKRRCQGKSWGRGTSTRTLLLKTDLTVRATPRDRVSSPSGQHWAKRYKSKTLLHPEERSPARAALSLQRPPPVLEDDGMSTGDLSLRSFLHAIRLGVRPPLHQNRDGDHHHPEDDRGHDDDQCDWVCHFSINPCAESVWPHTRIRPCRHRCTGADVLCGCLGGGLSWTLLLERSDNCF